MNGTTRQFVVAVVAVAVGLMTSGCRPASTPTPEPTPVPTATPVPTITPRKAAYAADVQRIGAAFEALSSALVTAIDSHDVETFRSLCTDDVVWVDVTWGDSAVGIDAVGPKWWIGDKSTLINQQVTNRFIGSTDSLAAVEVLDFESGGDILTQNGPFLTAFLLETRDGRISHWRDFYGVDAPKQWGGTPVANNKGSLLTSYGSAWSSGDPSLVGKLYAGNAVREDTIFGEHQEGSEAMRSFAKSFFAWYPGAQWTLLQVIGDWARNTLVIGGTFTVGVTDAAGHPCNVGVAVLLQASQDQITHEALYYEPDSLINCGWAR